MSMKSTVAALRRSLLAAAPGPLRGSGTVPVSTVAVGAVVVGALLTVVGINLSKPESVRPLPTATKSGVLPVPPLAQPAPPADLAASPPTDIFRPSGPIPTADFRDPRPLFQPPSAPIVPRPTRATETSAANAVSAPIPGPAVGVPPAPVVVAAAPPPAPVVLATAPPPAPIVLAAAPPPNTPPVPSAAPLAAALHVDKTTCDRPAIAIDPREGGLMGVHISSSCRAGEDVKVVYGSTTFAGHLDGYGTTDMVVDLYQGASKSAAVVFADGVRRVVPTAALGLDAISKVAVVWHAPVNLDLHAFEYGAAFEKPDHVWAGAPRDFAAAKAAVVSTKLGHGFISTAADGTTSGDQIEIYTFLHAAGQATGEVALSLDYQNRGGTRSAVPVAQTCGSGSLAKIDYDVYTLSPRGQVTSGRGTIKPVECNVPISTLLRFEKSGLPTLRFHK